MPLNKETKPNFNAPLCAIKELFGGGHFSLHLDWLVRFYGISTVVGYLMPNPGIYIYIYILCNLKNTDILIKQPTFSRYIDCPYFFLYNL